MKTKFIALAVVFVFLFSTVSFGFLCFAHDPFDSGVDWWPTFRHDVSHSGTTTSTAPTTNQTLWSFRSSGGSPFQYASAAVVDGVVYIGSNDNHVYALNASSGTQIWNHTLGSMIEPSPSYHDGVVYIASYDFKVYALNASTGSELWNYTTGDEIVSSPAYDSGMVFVGSWDNKVYGLDASNGSKIWSYTTGSTIMSSPAVADGMVFIGSGDKKIYALDETTGALIWNYTTGGGVHSSPSVVGGVVYAGSQDGKVYALTENTGSLVWSQTYGSAGMSSPAVAGGMLYIGSNDHNVYAMHASDGSSVWNFTTGNYVSSSPTVADGMVFFGSYDYNFYALNASTGAKVWSYNTGYDQITSSPTIADGVVYIGTMGGWLYAFGETPPPPPPVHVPWIFQTVDSNGWVGEYTSIALDSAGNPLIAYRDTSNSSVKVAEWNGSAWSLQTVDFGNYPAIAVNGSDYPAVAYFASSLKYAKWTGTAWDIQTVDSTGDVGYGANLAFDSSGNPRISYYDFGGAYLKYAAWTGSSWNIQNVASTGYGTGNPTGLALDSSGNPCISYRYASSGDLRYAKWTGSAWNIQTVDSVGDVGMYSSLALDSSGNPSIAYSLSSGNDYDLKFAKWTGSAWSTEVVDSTSAVGVTISLDLDAAGKAHISYADNPNGTLKYAKWTGSAWDIQTVDSSEDVGLYSSIKVDSYGNPHISYFDRTCEHLKYAHIFDANLNSITINNANLYTGSTGVNLSLTYTNNGSDASQVRFSNDNSTWTTWESPVTSKSWTLTSGEGTKTVYFQVKATDGFTINTYDDSIFLDITPPTGSMVISNGATYTTSTGVNLNITQYDSGSGADAIQISVDGGSTWGGWGAAKNPRHTGLPSGDGLKTVLYQVKDRVGLTSPVYSDTIILDTTSPSGSIAINNGDTYAPSTSATLNLIYSDATSGVYQVRYSNDGSSWSSWESPGATKSWTLTSGDGTKTVYYQIKDNAGLTSSTYSDTIILDTTNPTGSISINSGDTYTTSTSVTLTLTSSDATSGVSQVRYSNDGVSWNSWESASSSKSWTLSSGDGTKTVYFQVKDNAGLTSTSYTDTIVLDTTNPTGSISINNGDTYTTSTSATLTLTYSDGGSGVSQVRYSNDGITWSSWESAASTKVWNLAFSDGTKTVYFQVKDNAGLTSSSYTDTIVLDTANPTGSVVINSGAASTSTASVTLTLTYSDATSGVYQVRYSNDGSSWSGWESAAASKAWTLTSGDGTKTVYYQIKDNAGLTSATYTDTIDLQTPSPTPTPSSGGGNSGGSSTSTPSPTPAPTATPTPTPTATQTFIVAHTEGGDTINLPVTGNVTGAQFSVASISVNQAAATITVSFNMTGEVGTGFANVTIPKSAVQNGITPQLYIDGKLCTNQGYTQDAANFYVWYTTAFDAHQVSIEFQANSQNNQLPIYTIAAVAGIVVICIAIAAFITLKRKK